MDPVDNVRAFRGTSCCFKHDRGRSPDLVFTYDQIRGILPIVEAHGHLSIVAQAAYLKDVQYGLAYLRVYVSA